MPGRLGYIPQDWVLDLKNLFLPIFCKACGVRLLTEENGFFCPFCWESSPRIERPFCTGCGRPHESMIGYGARNNFPCATCREHPLPHLRRIYGAALFEGPVAEAVKLLKFQGKVRLAQPLGALLVELARTELDRDTYDYLVPVPLHSVRERARGFNQSRLLAQEALAAFPNARLEESLRRIRPTRTQSKLNGPDRTANVRGAFAVIGDKIARKKVLLVDDVVTTGGTVTECAAALQRAGAQVIDVLAVALSRSR